VPCVRRSLTIRTDRRRAPDRTHRFPERSQSRRRTRLPERSRHPFSQTNPAHAPNSWSASTSRSREGQRSATHHEYQGMVGCADPIRIKLRIKRPRGTVGSPSGATGSVLRPRAPALARRHGVGVPNPWHPSRLHPRAWDSTILNLVRMGVSGAQPTRRKPWPLGGLRFAPPTLQNHQNFSPPSLDDR
jgi:hypothetical protein